MAVRSFGEYQHMKTELNEEDTTAASRPPEGCACVFWCDEENPGLFIIGERHKDGFHDLVYAPGKKLRTDLVIEPSLGWLPLSDPRFGMSRQDWEELEWHPAGLVTIGQRVIFNLPLAWSPYEYAVGICRDTGDNGHVLSFDVEGVDGEIISYFTIKLMSYASLIYAVLPEVAAPAIQPAAAHSVVLAGVSEQVQYMLDHEGFYIGGHPDAFVGGEVPLVSRGGKIFSMVIDQELDPTRFIAGHIFDGPFRSTAKETL